MGLFSSMKLEPFDYASVPLQSRHSTRLVQIHCTCGVYEYSCPAYAAYNPNDVTVCTLQTHDVEELVVNDALSYTWDSPITLYQNQSEAKIAQERFSQTVPIICNGKTLMVGANIHDALRALRRQHRGGKPYYHPDSSRRSKWNWIDAISIDHANLEERSFQVSFMNLIYPYSQQVIIWLGERDLFVRAALGVTQDIFEAAQNYQMPSLIHSPEDYAQIGLLPELNLDHFFLYAFLQRS